MRHLTSFALCLVAVLSTAAVQAHEDHGQAAYGRPGELKNVDRVVRVVGSEIKYNVKSLTFKVGETVKFVFVNKGEQDHELTIGDEATQVAHRKAMQDMAAMAHMAKGQMDPGHDEENMVAAKPGESREIVWQFTKAGQFEFACNYPGHAEAGMIGTIIVQ